MLRVNQEYSTLAGFAGGRLWTKPFGQEAWAKPLLNDQVAIVLFNRGGHTPPCDIPVVDGVRPPILAPCDDDTGSPSYEGEQLIRIEFSELPREWLKSDTSKAASDNSILECDVFDVFDSAKQGRSLGKHYGFFEVSVPPHGVQFLILKDCASRTFFL